MTTQGVAVVALVILCLCYIVYRVFGKKAGCGCGESQSPCDSCATGCELHNMMLKKREDCSKTKKK